MCTMFVIKNHLSDIIKEFRTLLVKGNVLFRKANKLARTYEIDVQISHHLQPKI